MPTVEIKIENTRYNLRHIISLLQKYVRDGGRFNKGTHGIIYFNCKRIKTECSTCCVREFCNIILTKGRRMLLLSKIINHPTVSRVILYLGLIECMKVEENDNRN